MGSQQHRGCRGYIRHSQGAGSHSLRHCLHWRRTGYTGLRRMGYTGLRRMGYTGLRRMGYTGLRRMGYTGLRRTGYTGLRRTGYTGSRRTGYTGLRRTGYTGSRRTGYTGSRRMGYTGLPHRDCILRPIECHVPLGGAWPPGFQVGLNWGRRQSSCWTAES
ncbi:hypothetical protein DFP90_107168 [Aestuariispira insulae]|uniref:Uncharacterized protein n=1 Tax=Aestuariispira insulae TaxID=1461337 RepID=A0A3D9HGS4_9PROT|nr:hypothetical protein DFP90_107168 [Aestuariispira insulae]